VRAPSDDTQYEAVVDGVAELTYGVTDMACAAIIERE
jgi:hypothetical protein